MNNMLRISLGAALLVPAVLAAQDAENQTARRAERATALPLFSSREPLQFILAADYRTISRDRDTLSTKRYPGQLLFVPPGSSDTVALPVELRTRGHYRLLQRNCPFVPLRVDFEDKSIDNTLFDRQSGLKLVTHCRNDGRYEQYVMREEAVYRVHNIVTPVSYRSRRATVTYRDTTGKSLGTFPAFFIEHERDVARRNNGKIADELRGALFDDLDPKELARFALFEYMIGNTDWSIYALHNVRLIAVDGSRYLPAAYDFDFSGLVDAHYATPPPNLGIRDVRTRLYRGGCTLNDHVPEIANEFLVKKDAILAVYDSIPGLERGYAREAKSYLTNFFNTISNPRELKMMILDRCNRDPGA
jgi:hypothetical protein